MIVHHEPAEETSTGPWAAELCPFPAPLALEAFSQLPMAVRGSRKITQERRKCFSPVRHTPGCYHAPPAIWLRPPWSHGCCPPGDHGAKTQGFVKDQECGGLRDEGVEAPHWLLALQLSSMCPSEIL